MDPTGLMIVLDIAAVLVLLYVIDRNVFSAIDLLLSAIPTAVGVAWFRFTLGLRLWIDRKAFSHRGPLGRLWNEYALWKIRHNPAYKELFEPNDKA
jgi:hypothetical protein